MEGCASICARLRRRCWPRPRRSRRPASRARGPAAGAARRPRRGSAARCGAGERIEPGRGRRSPESGRRVTRRPTGRRAAAATRRYDSRHHFPDSDDPHLRNRPARGPSTRAIHAGQRPDPVTGAIMTPIYLTCTYVQEEFGVHRGYEYARGKNPTREALERNVAALEGRTHGFAFGSGMGCLTSIMKLFKSGDHIIVAENMYGGTYRLVRQDPRAVRAHVHVCGHARPANRLATRSRRPRSVILETPTNPLMRHHRSARAAAEIAQAMRAPSSSSTTPLPRRSSSVRSNWAPTSSVHSSYQVPRTATATWSAVSRSRRATTWPTRLQFILNAAGAVPGPFDAWLCLRGTKTLHIRMDAPRRQRRGRSPTGWPTACGHEQVLYPGLPSHPQHALAKRQMSGFGGMISIELGTRERVKTFLDRLRLFSLAESLGGVESLISHPASMTHASVEPARRAVIGHHRRPGAVVRRRRGR